jgi:hypothetical protein
MKNDTLLLLCDLLLLWWYILKQGLTHNPTLHFRHLDVVVVSLFFKEHTEHCTCFPSLFYISSWFGWLMEGVGFPCGMV